MCKNFRPSLTCFKSLLEMEAVNICIEKIHHVSLAQAQYIF
jgi:hypothetical protein